jgi:hypothetical protein
VPGRPADQRPEPRLELAHVEGLDRVVVGAKVQQADLVVDLGLGSDDEDRHVLPPAPDPAQDRDPVGAGQRQVQDDGVDRSVLERAIDIMTGRVPGHKMAGGAQAPLHRLADIDIVFHEQDVHVRF